jgi:regulator of protease activity HflC (stomatin/prohibitin superfamily)
MMFREKVKKVASGYPMLVILLLLQLATIYWIVTAVRNYAIAAAIGGIIAATVVLVLWIGFFMVNPNEAKVLQLFGKYIGTAKDPGLRWANPFLAKRAVSLRVRNFESGKLKVNDSTGNPIEIAAVVVWKVVDSAEAVFEVDDYEEFVTIQSEAALRNLATTYPYEAHNDGDVALRSDPQQIAGALRSEIQARLEKAGVEVIEARISHLAYAPEIANAMLRRQQASAIIAARTQIVDGAVGMVEMALDKLAQKHVLELDEERKATMVSNLLVVLCSEHDAQPVLNTGSLYT